MKKFIGVVDIHIADTDATGVIFFPKIFEKCLSVLEKFLKEFSLDRAILQKELFLPVIDAQAKYFVPILPFDILDVELVIKKIGNTSITFEYKFFNKQKILVTSAVLVHVFVDAGTREKKKIPENLHKSFSIYLEK